MGGTNFKVSNYSPPRRSLDMSVISFLQLMQPQPPPRPPMRTSEVTYAELTLPRGQILRPGFGRDASGIPVVGLDGNVIPVSKPASTSTFKSITSPPPPPRAPNFSPLTPTAPGPTVYASIDPAATALSRLPEAAEAESISTPPVPPMFADPPAPEVDPSVKARHVNLSTYIT